MDIIEVDNSIKSNKFLNETSLQLEKDFLMIGIHFDIEQSVFTYKDIFSFTFHLIESLNNQDPKKILNLLYTIDLSEEKVREEMQNTTLSFSEMLSEMIVKRELQKVIIKNYYSNPENQ